MKNFRSILLFATLGLVAFPTAPAHAAVAVNTNVILQFALTNLTVAEPAGRAQILVVRTGPKVGAVSVDYSTADGSSTAPDDYTTTSGTLVFSNGVTARTILVPIINDALVESRESFTVALSNPSGATQIGLRSNAVVNILDNDVAGKVALSAKAYTIGETSGIVQITVNRSAGSAANASVTLKTIDGTAASGSNGYVGTNIVVTFASNEVKKVVSIRILDDIRAEGPQTFRVQLSDPTGGATLGSITNAVVTILDNEFPVEGSYQITGTFIQTKCTNTDVNASTPIVGKLSFSNQSGNSFTGDALYFSTKIGRYQRQQIQGQVDAVGKVQGTFFWMDGQSRGGTGAITGKITGKTIQINGTGSESGDACLQKSALAGALKAPPTNGFAPITAPTNRFLVTITKATGSLAGTGVMSLDLSPTDDNYDLKPASGLISASTGKFIYSKTVPNAALVYLALSNLEIVVSSTFSYTSPTGGVYSAKALTTAGTQTGTFSVLP